MKHLCTINGREVLLQWTQERAKQIRIRLSKIGADMATLVRDMAKPKRAEYAVSALLWVLLPDAEYARHESPESLVLAIDDETEALAVYGAVMGVLHEMFPDPEKKSTLTKSPSPESNSG